MSYKQMDSEVLVIRLPFLPFGYGTLTKEQKKKASTAIVIQETSPFQNRFRIKISISFSFVCFRLKWTNNKIRRPVTKSNNIQDPTTKGPSIVTDTPERNLIFYPS